MGTEKQIEDYWATAASEETKAVRLADEGKLGSAEVARERSHFYTDLALEERRNKASWLYRTFGF